MEYFLEDGDPDDGWVPGMDHTGGWKRSQYHPRLGKIIQARLREGETIAQVCADAGMPSAATLHRWRHVHPGFGRAYARMMAERGRFRQMMARLERERWAEWARIEHKIGRRRTRTWVSGTKSTYERAWAQAFCARVAKGEAVYRICAAPGMPSCKAVYRWLKRQPEFVAMYVAAKAEAAHRLAFQAQMAADRALYATSAWQFRAIKRKVAKIEGRIGRLTPKTYRVVG
jgi:putative intracellular protease/amidase